MSIDDQLLSAWIDGELEPREADRVCAAVKADPTLAGRVARLRQADRLVHEAIPDLGALPPPLLSKLGLAEPASAGLEPLEFRAARSPTTRRTSALRMDRSRSGRGRLRAALGLAVASTGALGLILATQGDEGSTPAPAYRALSGPAAVGGNIILIIEPATNRAEVAALLPAMEAA